MKYLLLILSFLSCANLYTQNESHIPMSVNIKVDRAYKVKLPKKYFDYPRNRGEFEITTDSVMQQRYDIEIAIKNEAKEPVFIWMMSCGWDQNIKINNNYIYDNGWECLRNVVGLIKISSGESKIYKMTLCKSLKFSNPPKNTVYGDEVRMTKLGLIIVDDIFKPKLDPYPGYFLAMEDESLWKIIWSNPLYLLTDEEVHPKPVQTTVHKKE